VSGWAYPRQGEQLPKTRAELAAARDALIRQARARNATFRVTRSELTSVQGWPAVELEGTQRIFGKTIETRSVHVYRAGEYVFEALAPPDEFEVTNRQVFEPLLRTLRFRALPPS
jgi:hypothetical protein